MSRLCLVLVLLLCVFAVFTKAEAPTPDEDGVIELTDANWDEVVFADGENSKPHFVLFYAPWCGHCKAIKPVFRNASDFNMNHVTPKEYAGKSAVFGMLDATVNSQVAKRYKVKSFPTFIYTIRGQGYKYESGRGLNDFAIWGRYLDAAQKQGTFADDLSKPSVFTQLHDPKLAFERANFFFIFPKQKSDVSAETKANQNRLIDHIASHGRARFSSIYKGDAVAAAKSNEKEGAAAKKVVNLDVSQQDILSAYDALPASQKTTDGVAILLATDATYAPVPCPHSEWLHENGTVKADIVQWVTNNAFRAVEEINSDTFGVLARRGTLIIVATPGPTATNDLLPPIREIVKKRNKNGDAPLAFGHLDGIQFQPWLEQFGIVNIDEELPLVFGLRSSNEEVFLLEDYQTKMVPVLHAKKWVIDGPQQKVVEQLISQIDSGEMEGIRYTTVGKIVAVILKYAFFLKPIHAAVGGDAEFGAALFGFVVLMFVIVMSVLGGGEEDQQRSPRTPASPNATQQDMKKTN